jgi:heme A synthase
MTVRRPGLDVNTRRARSGMSGSASRRALLALRTAVILLGGLVAGVATGILTFFAVYNLPLAVLAAVSACAGAIKYLDYLIA